MQAPGLQPGLGKPQDPPPQFVRLVGVPVVAVEIDAQAVLLREDRGAGGQQNRQPIEQVGAEGGGREVGGVRHPSTFPGSWFRLVLAG